MRKYVMPTTKFVVMYEEGHLLDQVSEVDGNAGIGLGGGGDGTPGHGGQPRADEANAWEEVEGHSVWEE